MINPSIILFTLTSGNKNCYSQRGCQSGDSHWDFIIWHYCGVLWWNIPLIVEVFQWDSLIWSNALIINKSCDESPPSFLKPKKNPQLETITFVWNIEPNYFDVKIRNCLQFKFTWNTNAILISFPPLQSKIPSQQSDTVHYTDTLFQWWCPLPLKYCYLTRAMCFWLFKQIIDHRSIMQLAPWHQMKEYIIIEVCYIQTKWSYYANLPHQIFQCKHTQGIAASLRSCLYILHPLV